MQDQSVGLRVENGKRDGTRWYESEMYCDADHPGNILG